MVFRLENGALNVRLHHRADALEHQVERGQLPDWSFAYLYCNLLEDAQHRALPHRAVLAFEGVVLGQVLDRRLEQWKLVRDERVAVDEVVAILEVAVGLGSVGKPEQGFEVVHLRVVGVGQLRNAVFILRKQAFLDDLGDVGTGQLHPVSEACLNFRKVIALLLGHLPDDRVHVLLRRDNDPGPATGLGCKALGDGLEVGHQLDVVGDVLPDLVHEEVQAEVS
jgi:hypothetical protein